MALVTIFILFISAKAYAQEYLDVVEMRDGSIYKGIILENSIHNFIRIEISEGTELKILYSNIAALKREKKVIPEAIPVATGVLMNNLADPSATAPMPVESTKVITADSGKSTDPAIQFYPSQGLKNPYIKFEGEEYSFYLGYRSFTDALKAEPGIPTSLLLQIKSYEKTLSTQRFFFIGGLIVSLAGLVPMTTGAIEMQGKITTSTEF